MNRFLVNGKFKSQRFCHGRHPLPLSKKENRAALFLKEKLKKIKICCQGLVNLFRRATQSVLTEAPAWCVHGRGRESNSMQLKLPRTSFVSINSASLIFLLLVRCLCRTKYAIRGNTHPSHSRLLKYPMSYQTTDCGDCHSTYALKVFLINSSYNAQMGA